MPLLSIGMVARRHLGKWDGCDTIRDDGERIRIVPEIDILEGRARINAGIFEKKDRQQAANGYLDR